MIVQSFRSVMWVGAVAAAAIGCYMVSLRVASERATLEDVETAILVARRDIRALDTELSTRGRLSQLERWNNDVLALTAPTEGQFLEGEVQLAGLAASVPQVPAPVRLAAAPADDAGSRDDGPILATYRPRKDETLLVRASAPAKSKPDKPRAGAKNADAKPKPKPKPLQVAASKDAGAKAKLASTKPTVSSKSAPKDTKAAATKSAPKDAKAAAAKPAKANNAKIAAGKKAKAAKAL